MTLHRGFVTAGYLITVVANVPVWLPIFAIVAAVIVWVTRGRDRDRDRFQETAADAARAPLPKRTEAVVDTRPGSNQEALATCNAILYVTIIGEQR